MRVREREVECVSVGSRGSLRTLSMKRRKERREEGDSERVEVREGGECVGARGSLRSGSIGLV